jgi:hypothetical protein
MNMNELTEENVKTSGETEGRVSPTTTDAVKSNVTILRGPVLSHGHNSEWKVTVRENPASLRLGVLKVTNSTAVPFGFGNTPNASMDWQGWRPGDTATFQFRPGALFGTLTMIHDRTMVAYSISTGWCAGARHSLWASYAEECAEEAVLFSEVKRISPINGPEDVVGCLVGMVFLVCVVW